MQENLIKPDQNFFVKKNKTDTPPTIANHSNVVKSVSMRVSDKKNVSILCGLLPAISNFVAISTLLESNLAWLGVTLGFWVAVINAYALYRNEKKTTCWTRGVLVFLEVIGIICISYNAIQPFNKKVPSLPQPFDQYSVQVKMYTGIALLSVTLFFSLVLMYLENYMAIDDSRHESKEQKEGNEKNVIYAKKIITGGMVFVGTYPLMINFFTGLNHESCTLWLVVIAVSISLCSCIGQAFLISRHEKINHSYEKKRNLIILEWFGKFFMSIEIILSLANTAFSSNNSSFDECLQLLHADWVDKNSRSIGCGLFIASIIIFIFVTYQHFKPIFVTYNNHNNKFSTDSKLNSIFSSA